VFPVIWDSLTPALPVNGEGVPTPALPVNGEGVPTPALPVNGEGVRGIFPTSFPVDGGIKGILR